MRIVPLTEAPEPILTPDLVWDVKAQVGDLAIDVGRADLQCAAALPTAVLICLMTDRRVDPSELPDGETNRGWPGDAFDMRPGEKPLGSKLWLLRRRALTDATDEIELLAEDYARQALQTLIDQGVVVRVEVDAVRAPERNRMDLTIDLYGRDGTKVFAQRYGLIWDQLDAL